MIFVYVLVLHKYLLTNWLTNFIHKVLNQSCRNRCGRVVIFDIIENHDIAYVTSIVVMKTSVFKNLVCLFGLGKFGENILFFHVAKNPDLKNIVQTLFEHCGHKKPYLVDHDDAVKNLRCLLNKIGENRRPLMLVLDNVFQGSESFVNAFKVQVPDYKILITSRVKFPRFQTSLFLKPLRDDDAVTVFRHFALPNDGTTRSYVPGEVDVQKVCYMHPVNSLNLSIYQIL